jgi:multidrug resistance efflux pump
VVSIEDDKAELLALKAEIAKLKAGVEAKRHAYKEAQRQLARRYCHFDLIRRQYIQRHKATYFDSVCLMPYEK